MKFIPPRTIAFILVVAGLIIAVAYLASGVSKCYTYNGGLIEKPCD